MTGEIIERIQRLERCLLGLAAMISGEARSVTTDAEYADWQRILGAELQEMADDQEK